MSQCKVSTLRDDDPCFAFLVNYFLVYVFIYFGPY